MDEPKNPEKNLFAAAILRIVVLVSLVVFFALGFHLGRSSKKDPGVPAGAVCAAIAPSTVEERNEVWTALNGKTEEAAGRTPAGAMSVVIHFLLGPGPSRSLRDGIGIYANKMTFSFTADQQQEFLRTLAEGDKAAGAEALIKLFRADAHTASIAVDCLSDRDRMKRYFEGKPIPLE